VLEDSTVNIQNIVVENVERQDAGEEVLKNQVA